MYKEMKQKTSKSQPAQVERQTEKSNAEICARLIFTLSPKVLEKIYLARDVWKEIEPAGIFNVCI
jgi:hypothetical protein